MELNRHTKIGTTFSQLQCTYLDLDYRAVFKDICSLSINPIRLCLYWHEVESIQGQYKFEKLESLLKIAELNAIDVIMTIGVKAPRWPGFHIPQWIARKYNVSSLGNPLDRDSRIANAILDYVSASINHLKHFQCIKYWHVENGALNRSPGSNFRYLGKEFIKKELDLVRTLKRPDQKTALSLWMYPFPLSFFLPQHKDLLEFSVKHADCIGFNVYTRIPYAPKLFFGPTPGFWNQLNHLRSRVVGEGREAWVMEAQAEPWEFRRLVPSSCSDTHHFSKNRIGTLTTKLAQMGFSIILLWGCEYWYFCKLRGNEDWWNTVGNIAEEYLSS